MTSLTQQSILLMQPQQANQNCCGDITTTTTAVVVSCNIVVVGIKIIIRTILVCRGYIQKTFCSSNELILSVQ